MTERTLDIRKNLVSSSGPPRRRKSEAELRAMDHESRLFYEIFSAPTMSDSEKQRALELEDAGLSSGEIYTGAYHDDGPPDWSEDYLR